MIGCKNVIMGARIFVGTKGRVDAKPHFDFDPVNFLRLMCDYYDGINLSLVSSNHTALFT